MNTHPPEKDFSPEYAAVVAEAALAVYSRVGPSTVLDVGCNIGQWCRAFSGLGCHVTGIDSPYMEPHLLAPKPRFHGLDLEQPFCVGWFDLVLCLEVAEHLPASAADALVWSVVTSGEVVLWSAAAPGQGGWEHINEQPPEYWIEKFAPHGFEPDTTIRRMMPAGIPAYYRNNMMLFRMRGPA